MTTTSLNSSTSDEYIPRDDQTEAQRLVELRGFESVLAAEQQEFTQTLEEFGLHIDMDKQ